MQHYIAAETIRRQLLGRRNFSFSFKVQHSVNNFWYTSNKRTKAGVLRASHAEWWSIPRTFAVGKTYSWNVDKAPDIDIKSKLSICQQTQGLHSGQNYTYCLFRIIKNLQSTKFNLKIVQYCLALE